MHNGTFPEVKEPTECEHLKQHDLDAAMLVSLLVKDTKLGPVQNNKLLGP